MEKFNKRTYAVIPIEKKATNIKSNVDNARVSIDKKHIIWDENWDPATLAKMQQDPEIKLLTHEEALALMNADKWKPEAIIDQP